MDGGTPTGLPFQSGVPGAPARPVEPVATGTVIVERPPPGLARGAVASPAWVIVLIASLAIALGVGGLAWRWVRHRAAPVVGKRGLRRP